MSDFRFRALISVVFQPLSPACSLFLFRRINDDDDDDDDDYTEVQWTYPYRRRLSTRTRIASAVCVRTCAMK